MKPQQLKSAVKPLAMDLLKALIWCAVIILIVFLSIGYSSNFIYTDF